MSGQALERPQSSLELIDPKALRVCADPHNMPFSTEKGEGFENKVAELLAGKLGRDLSYTWYPQAPGFVRNTLAAHRCDVIMGAPQGDDMVQVTNPYYRTAYALVFKQGQGLDGVDTLEDPRLKGKRIGIVAGTPPGNNMATNGLMANAKPYPLVVDTRVDSSGAAMMRDLEAGDIDVGVLWGPMAGYYGQQARSPMTVVPLVKENEWSAPCVPHRDGRSLHRSGLEALAQSHDWGEPAGHQQTVAELCSPAARRQRSPHHRGARSRSSP